MAGDAESTATGLAEQNCSPDELAPGISTATLPAGWPAEARPTTIPADAAAAHAAFARRRHFASLDGLRCLSILAVLWHHSPHGEATPLTRGFLGVDLFFVLSGFLITTLLLRERDATGTISLRAFYMRRVLRIFPLYYATVLGLAALLTVWRPDTGLTAGFLHSLPWYLTYTSNWGPKEDLFAHAWSLAVEEQFYLLWPPFLVWLGTRRAAAALVTLLTAAMALDFGALGAPARDLVRPLAPFTAIGLGVLLGIGLHEPRPFAVIARIAGRRHAVLLPLSILAAAVWIPGDIAGWPRLLIHAAMTLLVAAVVIPEHHALAGLFRDPLVVHIGTISYGMYLLHGLCLIATHQLLGRRDPGVVGLFFAAGTVLTVVVASLSHVYFERPFLRLKRRFERRR